MQCLTMDECRRWRKEHSGRREWKRQLTCITPLQRLPWFTAELVRHLAPFHHALLIVDEVVFDIPPALEALRLAAGETRSMRDAPGLLFDGDPEEFRAALEAVLSGWIDFRVVFSPTNRAFRADHDEYSTLFTTSPGKIATLKGTLSAGAVKLVTDYTAEAP
jgi:hypothetical protein